MKGRDRYARQRVLPQIGDAGQARLRKARVTIIGCGALGCAQAQLLVRAGVGHLRLVDRDFVELENLHRQLLFDEEDAFSRRPKAEAAARRLRGANSEVSLDALIKDVAANNILEIVKDSNIVLDATDNVETRYLINDACVSLGIPWVYGGATGTEGLIMQVLPDAGPCLRCIFLDPPPPGSLPTCDVAGVLNTGPALVAALQATVAQQILVESAPDPCLVSVDLWNFAFRRIEVRREPRCPCCGRREFDFLKVQRGSTVTVLCGQNAVQISPDGRDEMDLTALAERLRGVIEVEEREQMIEFRVEDKEVIVFSDGRTLIRGTRDAAEARIIYARFIGA